jgi:predicted kinase
VRLPFAGKSTLARALAEVIGAELVSLDAINAERGLGLGGRGIAPAEWAASYADADRQIGQALSVGGSVVSDAAHFTRADRDRDRTIARRYSADTCVPYLPICPEEAHSWGRRREPQPPQQRDGPFPFRSCECSVSMQPAGHPATEPQAHCR